MPVNSRGMFSECESLVKTSNPETTKTLGDYVLEGGIKGRRFVDSKYTSPVDTIYDIQRIVLVGKGGSKPTLSVVGVVHGTCQIYMMNLVNCWNHEEYQESAQTLPKLTDPLENLCCPDRAELDRVMEKTLKSIKGR